MGLREAGEMVVCRQSWCWVQELSDPSIVTAKWEEAKLSGLGALGAALHREGLWEEE